MAKLATCPGCTTQLALPLEATLSDEARCPRCGAEFPLMEAVQFSIPDAELLPASERPAEQSDPVAAWAAEQALPSRSPEELVADELPSPEEFVAEELHAAEEAVPAEAMLADPASMFSDEPAKFDPAEFEPAPSAAESFTAEETPAPAGRAAADLTATLSDWEARLKRAMADTEAEEEEPAVPAAKVPTLHFAAAEDRAEDNNADDNIADDMAEESPKRSEPMAEDFSFPDEDLLPESQPAADPAEALIAWKLANDFDEQDEFELEARDVEPREEKEVEVAVPVSAAAPAVAIQTAEPPVSGKRTRSSARKSRSLTRTLMSASLGVVGIPLGLYALLWMKGPAGDVAHVANYLPEFMLPSAFHTVASLPTPPAAPSISESPLEETPLAESPAVTESMALENSEPLPAAPVAVPETLAVQQDPAVQPATAVQPTYAVEFPLVTGAEFSGVLASAAQAAPELEAGNMTDKASKSRKGHAYMALSALAEKSSFLHQGELTAAEQTLAEQAQRLLEATLTNDRILSELPQIALPWWQYGARPNQGMLLAGQVVRSESTPAGALTYISPQPGAEPLPVLLPGEPVPDGQFIGLAGTIVTDPAALADLPAGSGPVIVAHLTVPLGQN